MTKSEAQTAYPEIPPERIWEGRSDIEMNDMGSIAYLMAHTDAGEAWLRDNLQSEPWQWSRSAIAVEPRMAHDILESAADAGLAVSR